MKRFLIVDVGIICIRLLRFYCVVIQSQCLFFQFYQNPSVRFQISQFVGAIGATGLLGIYRLENIMVHNHHLLSLVE